VTTKPGHREELEGNRKAIAQGMPVDPGEPVATTGAFFAPTTVPSGVRHSPRLFLEVAHRSQNPDHRVAGLRSRVRAQSPVICRACQIRYL
jgi:hypothetical protein